MIHKWDIKIVHVSSVIMVEKDMVDPCKACAEIICMGICADRVHYKQEYQEMTDRIRQQIIDLCERVRNDKERTEREEKGISE